MDMQKVNGKIEEVEYFVSPNDTTMAGEQCHKFKIDGEWYFKEMRGETPTRTTFDLGYEGECQFEESFVEGEYKVIEGRRGNKHKIIIALTVAEPGLEVEE